MTTETETDRRKYWQNRMSKDANVIAKGKILIKAKWNKKKKQKKKNMKKSGSQTEFLKVIGFLFFVLNIPIPQMC